MLRAWRRGGPGGPEADGPSGRQFFPVAPGVCAAAPPPTRPPQHPSHPLRCAPREASWGPSLVRGASAAAPGGLTAAGWNPPPDRAGGHIPAPAPAKELEGGPTVNTTRLTVILQVVADVDLDEVAARDELDPAKDDVSGHYAAQLAGFLEDEVNNCPDMPGAVTVRTVRAEADCNALFCILSA